MTGQKANRGQSKRAPMMYETNPTVAALNQVPGFDPLKFLRRTVSPESNEPVWKLDLRYKRLWFRLACPKGRLKLTGLHITEKIAIFEAQVYLNRDDNVPISSYTATCTSQGAPGGMYVEAAQDAALNMALSNAGFGIQFEDASAGQKEERYGSEVPVGAALSVREMPVAPQQDGESQPAQDVPAPKQIRRTMEVKTTSAPQPVNRQQEQEDDGEPVVQPSQSLMEESGTAPQWNPSDSLAVQRMALSAEAPGAVEPPISVEDEAQPVEAEVSAENAPLYTVSTPVPEILQHMTLEEARNVFVDIGTCNGMTMAQVAERRPPSLKWYVHGYKGENNILRAAAQIMLDSIQQVQAG